MTREWYPTRHDRILCLINSLMPCRKHRPKVCSSSKSSNQTPSSTTGNGTYRDIPLRTGWYAWEAPMKREPPTLTVDSKVKGRTTQERHATCDASELLFSGVPEDLYIGDLCVRPVSQETPASHLPATTPHALFVRPFSRGTPTSGRRLTERVPQTTVGGPLSESSGPRLPWPRPEE